MECDEVIATKYPGVFSYKYRKYVPSIAYLKGTVHIFNMGYGLELNDQLVKYTFDTLGALEGVAKEDFAIYRFIKTVDTKWSHKKKVNGDAKLGNFIALYYDDKTYLVNEIAVADDEMAKILDGEVDVLIDVDINIFKDFEPFSTMPYVYTTTANVVKYENMSSQYKHIPDKLTTFIGTLY